MAISCSSRPNSKPTTLPRASVQSVTITAEGLDAGIVDTLRFGRMRSGEVVPKSLELRNESGKPIVLLRHVTSCGCMKIRYDRKPIPSGESAVIDFEFDSRTMYGWQMKLMEFYLSEKDKPLKVYAEAEIE